MTDLFKKEFLFEFENKLYQTFRCKLLTTCTESRTVRLRIPIELRDSYTTVRNISCEDLKKTEDLKEGVKLYKECLLSFDCDILKTCITEACSDLLEHIRTVLNKRDTEETYTIVIVGALSPSPIFQSLMRNNFPAEKLQFGNHSHDTVVSGACLFGFSPPTIVSRVARCSYGVSVYRDFVDGKHPEEKRVVVGDKIKCKDIFSTLVYKGQELVVGVPHVSQLYQTLEEDQEYLVFEIYATDNDNVKYVTDDACFYLGRLELEVPNKGNVNVSLTFGETEIKAVAKDETPRKISSSSLYL